MKYVLDFDDSNGINILLFKVCSIENEGNDFDIESLVSVVFSVSSTAGSQGLKIPTEAWWSGRFQRV